MAGISVGWFDRNAIAIDPDGLTTAIVHLLKKDAGRRRHWPMAVRSIRWDHKDVGVSYVLVDGALPLHMDPQADGPRTDGFLFVLHARSRPALATAPATSNNAPIFGGYAPPTVVQTFALGCLELRPGMAIYIDTADTWHGITALPPVDILTEPAAPPHAVIVKVTGYGKQQIGEALDHAAHWIAVDLAASSTA